MKLDLIETNTLCLRNSSIVCFTVMTLRGSLLFYQSYPWGVFNCRRIPAKKEFRTNSNAGVNGLWSSYSRLCVCARESSFLTIVPLLSVAPWTHNNQYTSIFHSCFNDPPAPNLSHLHPVVSIFTSSRFSACASLSSLYRRYKFSLRFSTEIYAVAPLNWGVINVL